MLYDHAHLIAYHSGVWLLEPRPKQYHPAPQGLPFTGCPPEAHNQSQLKHPASSRPKCTQLLQGLSAAPPTQELTSFPVWAEQYSVITTTSASNHRHVPSGRTGISTAPAYGASLTDMASPLTPRHAPRGIPTRYFIETLLLENKL